MDGTLTEARKKINSDMVVALNELSKYAKIGIVTGSDFDYVMQQCDELLASECGDEIEIFPCNGTKHYRRKDEIFESQHNVEMIEEIGRENYNYLLQTLTAFQLMITLKHKLPYSGTFFQYRDSMLNWCPIGRQAGDASRFAWTNEDKEYGIRQYFLGQIENVIKEEKINLTVALGGATSFDIYPDGWDKTYVMNHLDEFNKVLFVGDRCQEGGNDKALYDLLSDERNSFETTGPEQTLEIINNIIKEIRKDA
tara:strand:- start:2709 stop:3467 length:759 start_codon:yes stop_codon:yes gene_type:complete